MSIHAVDCPPPIPSRQWLNARVTLLEKEIERLQSLIASGVERLHGDDDRLEVADFLEREAAPW